MMLVRSQPRVPISKRNGLKTIMELAKVIDLSKYRKEMKFKKALAKYKKFYYNGLTPKR